MKRFRRHAKTRRRRQQYLDRKSYDDKLAAGMERALRKPRRSGPVLIDLDYAYGGQTMSKTPLQAKMFGHMVHDEVFANVSTTIDYAALECRVLSQMMRSDEPTQKEALRSVLSALVCEEGQASCGYGAGSCRQARTEGEDVKLRRAGRLGTLLHLVTAAQGHLRASADIGGPWDKSRKVQDFIQSRTAAALKNYL